MRERRTEVLVIGAGPAGIAAAIGAERAGARAMLVDMQVEPGGQVWRGQWRNRSNALAARWLGALEASPVECRYGARLIDLPEPGTAVFDTCDGALAVRSDRVVIATGARELLLPFPGWTLPGVFGAGGLQVLAKDGWPVAGKRIVIGGSGPLLLAVADSLRERGAEIVLIAEQASWSNLAGFLPNLAYAPSKLAQSLGYAWRLAGVPYRAGAWVERVEGVTRAERVHVRIGERRLEYTCDAVAVGFGLVPNTDCALAFGCELRDGKVWVDAHQHTSVPGIYCAGEGTGIGGVDQALAEGEIAGCAAAGRAELAASARRRRTGNERFAQGMRRRFAPRQELRALAQDDTCLCRCESITVAAARACKSSREARLHARIGMGQCQGRVCSAAGTFLFGWPAASPRPPFAPVSVDRLNYSTLLKTTE